jgi:hypothetical protein
MASVQLKESSRRRPVAPPRLLTAPHPRENARMRARWVPTSRKEARHPSRRRDLEENRRPTYALIIVSVSGRRGYLYRRTAQGALALAKEFPVVVGQPATYSGACRTRIGLFTATEIHQNYETAQLPSDYRGLRALSAPFGAFALHMAPDAAGQWMHGTKALVGDLSVVSGIALGSHGCIRCPNTVITELVHHTGTGTPVLRIYPSGVARGGRHRDVRNIYGYTDVRPRVFTPDAPGISGPAGALLGPEDAECGGLANVAGRLRAIGVSVEELPEPDRARTPAHGPRPPGGR